MFVIPILFYCLTAEMGTAVLFPTESTEYW